MDTRPGIELDRSLRAAQVELRLAELEEAFYILSRICAGAGEALAQLNLRGQGYMGGNPFGLAGVDWAGWKGRINLDHVTIAGHSFGGATVVEASRQPHRFPWAKQVIIYDIWRFVIPIRAERRPFKPTHSS